MSEHEITREIPKNWRDYLRDSMETFEVCRWVWRELKTPIIKRWVRVVVIAMVVMTVANVIQPKFISGIVDGALARDWGTLKLSVVLLVAAFCVQILADYVQSVAREWMLGKNSGRLDHRITKLFFEKSLGQHLQLSSILHVGNIEKGRSRVQDLQGMLLFEGIPSLLSLVLSYVFLWTISVVAGLIMTGIILMYVVWMLYLNRKVVEVCTPLDHEFRKINRYRFERWEKTERVKISGRDQEEVDHLDSWYDTTLDRDRSFWLWFIKQTNIRGAINTAGLLVIMAYGTHLVWTGHWNPGLLFPLFMWSMQVSQNIWRIGHIEHMLNWSMPAIKSMRSAVTLKPDIVDSPGSVELKSHEPVTVRFMNVSYHYPSEVSLSAAGGENGNGTTLGNISFSIDQGDKVALIGSSGAGKTTVMRLLLRFMDPQQGSILVNGYDLRDVKYTSWMRQVGYIPQQSQVFDGTIRDNITYGLTAGERSAISDEEIWSVMKQLKIDFENRLVNGLDTMVGRNGLKLSGGQAQRLMIGAAALKKPRFMIIDEATSSLDSTTEKAVQKGLEQVLEGDVSALVVAHRLSTVRKLCNKFVVLKNASSVKEGETQIEAVAESFELLYMISPIFRRLADDQELSIASIQHERLG